MIDTDMLRRLFACLALVFGLSAHADDAWFETFKREASAQELYKFLYAMPKGGDLHIHLSGSVHPEWLWQLALDAQADGYTYYTKVRINECKFGSNEFGPNPYLLMFHNLAHYDWERLSECEQGEYEPLGSLSDEQRAAWLDSLRLEQAHEGRMEFFEALWPRISALISNPNLMADTIVRNMQAFGAEGVRYIEGQVPILGFRDADGKPVTPQAVAEIYRERLAQADAKATGVTIRFQLSVLRFLPQAEQMARHHYAFIAAQPQFVAMNLVGREDNDKGFPLRFLDTIRDMRRTHSGVNLSIHAGEVDEPNQHVRDTLLLGAQRIGHGVNLITDPDTLLLMRRNEFLVEINLVSNLLLEYVEDYSTHPFPEYLRIGVPVALSTDDRGMWDSTMTDEFYVAVKEFNLTWAEINLLLRNSIQYSFLEDETKTSLLAEMDKELKSFAQKFKRRGVSVLNNVQPQYRGFICRQYQICAE